MTAEQQELPIGHIDTIMTETKTIEDAYAQLRERGAKGPILAILVRVYNAGRREQIRRDQKNRTNYDTRSIIR